MARDSVRRRNWKNVIDEEQRKAEKARARKGLAFMIVFVVALAGVMGGLVYYMSSAPSHEGYQPTTPVVQPPPQGQNVVVNDITIPVSDVTTNAKFYTYDSSGVTVRFFLAKGSDGKVHLAADACDVCYANKKGYKQTGDVMTCNNCGQTFAINSIGTANTAGGCWPSYIPLRTEGGNVLIQKTALDGKRSMFA